MPDPNQAYYDWKEGNLKYAPIEFEDKSFSHFTPDKRAQLWDSGLRPARQGWAKAFPDEKDMRVQFVDKGQLSYRNKQGIAKPEDQFSKENWADEMKAMDFELKRQDKPPLAYTDKSLTPADRYIKSIQYFRDNPEDTNRFDAGRMAHGFAKRLPLTFGVLDWMEMGHDKAAMDRMYEGTATDHDYFKLAKSVVIAEQEEEDPEALHYLRTISHLPGFAADIAATGGLSAFTKAVGAKAAGKLAKHLGAKKFKEFIQKSMVKKVAGAGMEAATFAGITRLGTTVGEAIPTRDLKFDESTETGFAKTEKDSWFNTLPKSIANQMLEYSVEKFTGAAVGKLAGKGRTMLRKPGKVDPSVIPDDLMNLMKKRAVTAWKIQNPGRAGLAGKIGYNGMVTEMGEEYLTMALQGVNEAFFAALPGYERDAGPQIEGKFGGVGGMAKELGYQAGVTSETAKEAAERRKGMWKEFRTIGVSVGAMGGAMRAISGRPGDDPVLGHKDPILGMAAVSTDPKQQEVNEQYRKDVFDLIQSGESSRNAFEQVNLPDGSTLLSHYPNIRQRVGFLEEAAQMGKAQFLEQQEQDIVDRAEAGLAREEQQGELQATTDLAAEAWEQEQRGRKQAALEETFAPIPVTEAVEEAPVEQPAAVEAPPVIEQEAPQPAAVEAPPVIEQETLTPEPAVQEAPPTAPIEAPQEAEVEAPPVIKQPVLDIDQDNKNVETVSQIGIADVRNLVPGRKVTETEYGFDVFFEGGRVPVYMSQDMDLTPEQVETIYNNYIDSEKTGKTRFTQWEKDSSGKYRKFSEVFPTAEAYGEKLAEHGAPALLYPSSEDQLQQPGWDILATIRINDTDWSRANRDQMKGLRHELVHVAHLSGMWNKAELDALIKQYSDPNKSAAHQSEDLAVSMELWSKPKMMERFTDWINRLMNKIMPGKFELKPSAVENLLQQEKFWGRQTQEFSEFMASQDQGKQPDVSEQTLGMAEGDLDIHGRDPDQTKQSPVNPGISPQARKNWDTADADRVPKKVSRETVRLELNRLRGGTVQERKAVDEAALDRWRNNPKSFDVFDHEHMIRWAEELSFSPKPGDYELALEVMLMKREAVAEQARSVAYGKDPFKDNPILSRHSSLLDAVFNTDRDSLALYAQRKSNEPRKAKAGQKAFDKEEKRVAKIQKYVEKLGYDFTSEGMRKLARNRKDSYKVAQVAVRSKWGYGTWANNVFTEYTYGSMLSGMNTQMVNLLSNTTWGAAMELEQFGAAAVNSVFGNHEAITMADYKAAWKRGELKHKPAEMASIMATAVQNGWTRLWTEHAVLEEQVGVEEQTKLERNVPAIPGVVGKGFRMIHGFGPMTAVDQFYKTLFTHMDVGIHAYSLARRQVEKFNRDNPKRDKMTQADITRLAEEMINDKTSEAWHDALREAEQKMFQDEGGAISQGVMKLAKTARDVPIGGAAFQHLIAPFVRTPTRLMGNAMIRMPGLGSIVTTYNMYKNHRDGKHVLDGLSRELVGQITVLLLAAAIAQGVSEDEEETRFTGAKGSLGKDSRSFRYHEGVAPSQGIRMFGRWISYDRFDPFAVIMASIVDGVHAWKSSDNWVEGAGAFAKDAALSTVASLQEKSFARSFGDMMKAFEDDDDKMQRWLASSMTRLYPNLYQQMSRAGRETIGEKRGENLWEETLQRAELARSEDIHDSWGRKAKSAGWLIPYVLPMPIKSKSAEDTFVGDDVYRSWNRDHPDAKEPAYPSRPSRDYIRNGVQRRMDKKTYADYTEIAGSLARHVIEKMVSDEMGRNPNDQILRMVEGSFTRSRKMVKDHLMMTGGLEDFDMKNQELLLESALYTSMVGVLSKKPPVKYGQPTAEHQEEMDKWQRDYDAAEEYGEWYSKQPNAGKIRQ